MTSGMYDKFKADLRSKNQMNIYLAGPFFNRESKDILYSILGELEVSGHEVWSPMRDGITCPPDADREMRLKVFNLDCEQLHWAECIVALLDYPLPPHQQLLLRQKSPEGTSKDTPIFLPDPGTIFEIGYVSGLNSTRPSSENYKYIVGYAICSGFNLMVAEACDCIVNDLRKLERVMELVAQQDSDGLMLLKIQYQKKTQLKEL